MIPIKDLIGVGKKQITFAQVDIPTAATYSSEDADVTLQRPPERQGSRKRAWAGSSRTWNSRWFLFSSMELAGVRVDIPYLMDLSREFSIMLEKSETEIHEMAGEEFNINSPKQLAEVLFTKLGLKPTKKTKTGPSTSRRSWNLWHWNMTFPAKSWSIVRSTSSSPPMWMRSPAWSIPRPTRFTPLVQSGGSGHRKAVVVRPEPGEYPGQDPGRPKDPASVCSRKGARLCGRGLLPDRVAGDGAPCRRQEASPSIRGG